jgi:hypothetical protein
MRSNSYTAAEATAEAQGRVSAGTFLGGLATKYCAELLTSGTRWSKAIGITIAKFDTLFRL